MTYWNGNSVISPTFEKHKGAFSAGSSLGSLSGTPKYPVLVVFDTSNVTIDGVPASPPEAGIYGVYKTSLFPKALSITYECVSAILDFVSDGSTIRFRITVDDSGTLSAVEITRDDNE